MEILFLFLSYIEYPRVLTSSGVFLFEIFPQG